MVNFGPLPAEICWRVWGTPANFNGFRVLACSVTARHSSTGRQPEFAALNTCEFRANPFSGSQDYFTNKQKSHRQRQNRTYSVHCLRQLQIRSVARGICPVAESIMTETVISVRRGYFGDSAISKGYIAYIFNADAQNCLISISGLISDVIIVFLDPCFAEITAIRERLRQRLAY